MDHLAAIEAAPSFRARVMNVPVREDVKRDLEGHPKGFYLLGHKDARHAAAEIAAEADAQIAALIARLREAEARRVPWNMQPQIAGDEAGREPSLRAIVHHYYTSHGISEKEARSYAIDYIAAIDAATKEAP